MKLEKIEVTQDTCGIVFATTGEIYTNLARRAARTIRGVMPDANIDLFTDQGIDDDIFDAVHQLPYSNHRPRMYAMRASRFERTLLLDADIVVVLDISNVFEVLDRYDIAGVIAPMRTKDMMPSGFDVPSCVNNINAGVLLFKSSQKIREFSTSWEAEMTANSEFYDQPSLRRLLYRTELSFLTLPVSYNCLQLSLLDVWQPAMGAPRILHVPRLHTEIPSDPNLAINLIEAVGIKRAIRIRKLIETDWSLAKNDRELALSVIPAKLYVTAIRRRLDAGSLLHRARANFEQKRYSKLQILHNLIKRELKRRASTTQRLNICVVGLDEAGSSSKGKHAPFFKLIRQKFLANTELTIVERQKDLIQFVEKNFKYHQSYQVVSAVIGRETAYKYPSIGAKFLRWFSGEIQSESQQNGFLKNLNSFDKKQDASAIKQHLPKERNNERISVKYEVPCYGLKELLIKRKIDTNIDFLQLGMSKNCDEVLYACDIDELRPAFIHFCHSSLSSKRKNQLRIFLKPKYHLKETRSHTFATRNDVVD